MKDVNEPAIFRMRPQREIKCVVTLETKDELLAIPSTARMSIVGASTPDQGKLAFVNELFALVVSVDEGVEFKRRATGSTKLRVGQLAQLATMLSWNREEVKIRVTGENTPETVFPTAVITQNAVLDGDVAAAIGV